jgi:hypothetical protein
LFTTTGSSATSHRFDRLLNFFWKRTYPHLTFCLWVSSRGQGDARLPQLLC